MVMSASINSGEPPVRAEEGWCAGPITPRPGAAGDPWIVAQVRRSPAEASSGARRPGAWAEGSPRIWLDATATLQESETGERGQPVHQLVLESRVTGLWCGLLSLPVVPVAAAHGCGWVVADGEPCLREVSLFQVAGCRGAAHLGRHPARVDGVAEYVRPSTGQGERERGCLALTLGGGLSGVPLPISPVDAPRRPATCVLQSAAEVDQPVRAVDQRGQQVGGEGVQREGPRVAVGGRRAGRLEEDAGIV